VGVGRQPPGVKIERKKGLKQRKRIFQREGYRPERGGPCKKKQEEPVVFCPTNRLSDLLLYGTEEGKEGD